MECKPKGENRIPLYQQIAAEIEDRIRNGTFKKGTRLPSEVTMSRDKGVAVGTVKKAYAALESRGFIYKIRGGGSYVSGGNTRDFDETELPIEVVGRLIRDLTQKGFRMNQIYAMVQKQMEQVFSGEQRVKAALVDCNLETIHDVMNDLGVIPCLETEPFLLEELFSGERVIGSEYSLAIVSQKHYGDFIRYADSIHLRTEEMALRESRETIARLTVIPDWQEICVLYRSQGFLDCVQYTLKCLGKKNKLIAVREQQLSSDISRYMREKIPFIIPPDYMDYSGARLHQIVGRARKVGSMIVPFEFEIDKGSLLHLRRIVDEIQSRGAEGNR